MVQKTQSRKHGVKLRQKVAGQQPPPATKKGGGLNSAAAKAQTTAAIKRAERDQLKQVRKQQRADRELTNLAKKGKQAKQISVDPTIGKVALRIDAKTIVFHRPGANIQSIINTYRNRVR